MIPLVCTGFPALSNRLCFGYTNYIIIRATQANTLRFNTPSVWDFRISQPTEFSENQRLFRHSSSHFASHPYAPPDPDLCTTRSSSSLRCVCVCLFVCLCVCVCGVLPPLKSVGCLLLPQAACGLKCFTLGPHSFLTVLHPPYPTLHCDVRRVLIGAPAQPALPRLRCLV
jgi:hypothetical protein